MNRADWGWIEYDRALSEQECETAFYKAACERLTRERNEAQNMRAQAETRLTELSIKLAVALKRAGSIRAEALSCMFEDEETPGRGYDIDLDGDPECTARRKKAGG